MGYIPTPSVNARELARVRLQPLPRRWQHVHGVGQLAQDAALGLDEDLVAAAWLHDVGYCPDLVDTSLHSLDGARYLLQVGAPSRVVSLVAHHTGAVFEAQERGLSGELARIPTPNQKDLDILTLLDLCVSPEGLLTHPARRVAEILSRYTAQDPVHRAVSRAALPLLEAARRARARLGLADEWPVRPG